MSIAPTSPVTGGAQTGFTSPTYTIVADIAPDNNGLQRAVTALGGTQAGVTTHSVSSPFTVTFTRPKSLKQLPAIGLNGQYNSIPNNNYKVLVRKGVTPALNQPARVMQVGVSIDVPAGADTYDPANIRAAISLAVGYLNQLSAGIGDTVTSGVM